MAELAQHMPSAKCYATVFAWAALFSARINYACIYTTISTRKAFNFRQADASLNVTWQKWRPIWRKWAATAGWGWAVMGQGWGGLSLRLSGTQTHTYRSWQGLAPWQSQDDDQQTPGLSFYFNSHAIVCLLLLSVVVRCCCWAPKSRRSWISNVQQLRTIENRRKLTTPRCCLPAWLCFRPCRSCYRCCYCCC